MLDLIKIEKKVIGNEEQNCVNLRDLWEQLKIKKQFTDWAIDNLKMFSEGNDYGVLHLKVKNLTGGRPRQEYVLTLDTAKHIALMSRTEKGMEIRNYFIEVEKRAKT